MPGVYSVTQINTYIRNLFARDIALSRVTVAGEVSNCRYHPTGHIYLTLKDENASISCVVFQSSRAGLQFRLSDGQKIEATGQISVYEKSGTYQLYIRSAVLAGQGELYERFLKLKQELAGMGMFDPGYKKEIPAYAMRIGIVTAETGAAIRDIVNVTRRRNPYAELLLMPARVQGTGAAEEIAAAVRRLDRLHPDVMIVGRGGGSIEDLWAFNEEIVARAVFDCETPVISAVGHETDFTIIDFVADLRAPTPSAAAELANFDYAAFDEQIRAYRAQLDRLETYRLRQLRQALSAFGARLEAAGPDARLQKMRERLRTQEVRLNARMRSRLQGSGQRCRLLSARLDGAMRHRRERTLGTMRLLAGRLDALSPLRKLSGGYGYLTAGGRAVKSAAAVNPGDSLTAWVADGRITASVTAAELTEIGKDPENGGRSE